MQLKYKIRKLSREHKVREDKLEINKMVFHAMSQALTETEALLRKRAKSNVGVASVEGESGDIETDELSFPKRQDVSSQGNVRPNTNLAHQAESSKLVNSLEELTKQQQIQQQQDLIVQGMKTLQQSQLKISEVLIELSSSLKTSNSAHQSSLSSIKTTQTDLPKVDQSMKDVKSGVTSVATKLSDTQTQFAAKVTNLEEAALKMHCSLQDKRESESVAVPNSTTEEVPTSKDQSGPVQELKDVETSSSDNTLDQFVLKKRSAAETESAQVGSHAYKLKFSQKLVDMGLGVIIDTEADQQPKETEVENVQTESALVLEKEVVEREGISVLETAVTSQTQADPSEKAPTQTNSSSNEYFSIRRDSAQGQAVLQAVGLRQHEVVVQRGKEKTLLEVEEEQLKSMYVEERRIEDIKGAIAARLLHEDELKKRKEELDRIAGNNKADEEMIKKMRFSDSEEDEPSKSKKKRRKGPSKPSKSSILLKNPNLNLNFNLQLQQVMECYQYEEMDDQANENTEMENIENRDSNNTEIVKILDRNKHQINPFNKFQNSQPLVNKILRNTVDFCNILKDKKRPVTMESLLVIDETLENFLSEVAAMESQPVIENADADVVQEENAGAATGSTGDDVAGAATESTGDGVQVEDAVADEVTRGRGENAGAATGSTGDDVAGAAATGSTGDGVQMEDAVVNVVNRGR
uniref:Uncharacterized protein n=1 Tax=Tanacetum cinerariifolium TaxID=118510 RepID=A0A6L2NT14_TANCI|nr:hypothetical protein [Tanacetum cinerariifolium]